MASEGNPDFGRAAVAAPLLGSFSVLGFALPDPLGVILEWLPVVAWVLIVVNVALLGFAALYSFKAPPASQNADSEEMEGMGFQEKQLPPASTANRLTLSQQIRSIDWFQFEKLIDALYTKKGFEVSRRGGANPDGEIDLILAKNGEQIAVQCKHWKTSNLGVSTVREFLGAMTDSGIHLAIIATLAKPTNDAANLAAKHGIQIVGEPEILNLLQDCDAGGDPAFQTLLQPGRKFCPKCEKPMLLRTSTKGVNAGSQFWGCSGYPKCRFTFPTTKQPVSQGELAHSK